MATAPAQAEEQAEPGGLQRVISRPLLIIFVLGDILGAGIYAVVGEVAGTVGGAIWAAFLAAFLLAVLTAFAYAELVTKYPQAAGAALYVHKAFSVPFLTFLVAVAVMASGVTSASTAARAFGGDYLAAFVDVPIVPVALGFLLALEFINFLGISHSVRLNAVLSLIEAAGLVFIIGIGVAAMASGDADPSRLTAFPEGEAIPLVLLSGAGLAFFSFLGFEDSVNVAEETRDPQRSFPIALFAGLGLALLIYLAVAATAALVVDPGTLSESDGPLLEVVRAGAPALDVRWFSVVALIAVANTALINLIMASRLLYGLARQGIVPALFARVHGGRRTPWVAIIATLLVGAILTVTGDLAELATTTVILLLVVFAMVDIAVLVLRRDRVDTPHFHAPTVLPVLGAVASVGLIVFRGIEDPSALVRAGILLLVGVGLWGLNYVVTRRVPTIDPTKLEGD